MSSPAPVDLLANRLDDRPDNREDRGMASLDAPVVPMSLDLFLMQPVANSVELASSEMPRDHQRTAARVGCVVAAMHQESAAGGADTGVEVLHAG